jgi:F-type H+-transporting ATPase subunit b
MYNLTLILATEKIGGLFDLDGTLPLMAIQFLALMFLLNVLTYTPLLALITERQKYITENLDKSVALLEQSTVFITKYENELDKIRKEAQVEISTLQNLYKNILETELRSSQKVIDEFLIKVFNSFHLKNDKILFSLENEIESLSRRIILKLLA